MTTLRESATTASTATAGDRRVHGGAMRLRAFPAVPDSGRIRARLTGHCVTALRVVDLGLRERPGTGDRRRGLAVTNDRVPGAITEVRDVDDREHHRERGKRRVRAERTDALRQLLGLAATG